MDDAIEDMKASLRAELSEWLGFDIPEEGDEDYDTWQARTQLIDGISSVEEIRDYLSTLGRDDEAVDEFFDSFDVT